MQTEGGQKVSRLNVSKDTFITLFLILVLVLLFMPFLATFNDLLTRLVINLKGYWFIREVIVPFEVLELYWLAIITVFCDYGFYWIAGRQIY
ncbi:MAG: hypothetical protein UU56_C0007G0003 [Candidatus Curtissbacteria bacterium GW2011_GWA2_41_24]|uniref:Uncharacterized protein n=1 Tax=Candidatus Curtissbacteria bacterium GW2011_GWA2_41_24 TaxID=1618411 RepID=A0A0G0Y4C0_9BACT|nr:MAG: hypothetical protein UU56_C0007G0003 [Candidatus Curtissbacteria bacterium GW2011_GWA2_41_24]